MHKSKNKAKKLVSKAIGEKAEEVLTEVKYCPNVQLGPIQGLNLIVKKKEKI